MGKDKWEIELIQDHEWTVCNVAIQILQNFFGFGNDFVRASCNSSVVQSTSGICIFFSPSPASFSISRIDTFVGSIYAGSIYFLHR